MTETKHTGKECEVCPRGSHIIDCSCPIETPAPEAVSAPTLEKNQTPQWIYDFNKFLLQDRSTGEIIEHIRNLLSTARADERKKWLEQEIIDLEYTRKTILLSPKPSYDFLNHVTFTISTKRAELTRLNETT